MGRKFNKKNAQTFSVVHRAHDDALYFDNDASEHVLVPVKGQKGEAKSQAPKKKIYTTEELASKLSPDEIKTIRANEGLAAQFGIFFDDSKYDYMQHLKPIGTSTDGVFIEAKTTKETVKKGNIEDLFKDQLPSKEKRNITHDDLANIPAQLQGFQPDMDPRLREVLEALEDEAYIEEGEEEDDVFASLLESGQIDEEDDDYYGSEYDDYDEWDMDNYDEDHGVNYGSDNYEEAELPYNEGEAPEELNTQETKLINTNWENDFNKFKKVTKSKANDWDSDDEFDDEIQEEEENDTLPDLPSFNSGAKSSKKSNSKLRKKKGAMTDTSSFSMSSSANFRTEGLTLLDDRYEQLAKKFEEDDEEEEKEYTPFQMENERTDLESMLDDFLDNYELESGGRKLAKKNDDRRKIQEAADSASKSKVAARRKKEKELEYKLNNLSLS